MVFNVPLTAIECIIFTFKFKYLVKRKAWKKLLVERVCWKEKEL